MNFSSIIAAGIMGLATLASQSDAFQVRFKPVAQQTTQQQSPVRQVSNQFQNIEINRILFTDGRATGFNQLKVRSSTTFRRGEQMDIYFEPGNLATRYEGGNIRASMTVDLEVRNEKGEVVANQDGAWKIPLAVSAPSHQQLVNIYAAMSTTPINLPAGTYQVKLRIHDDFGGTFIDRRVSIIVQG